MYWSEIECNKLPIKSVCRVGGHVLNLDQCKGQITTYFLLPDQTTRMTFRSVVIYLLSSACKHVLERRKICDDGISGLLRVTQGLESMLGNIPQSI